MTRLLLTIWLLSCMFLALGQQPLFDSLHKELAVSKDTAAIDILNELGYQFIQQSNPDSARYYAGLAYDRASAKQYLHGQAEALGNKAAIASHFFNDFIEVETLGNKSLELFSKTGNKKNIVRVYQQLGFSYFAQGKFKDAVQSSEKLYSFYKESGNEDGMSDVKGLLTVIYIQTGEYKKAFELAAEMLSDAVKANEPTAIKGAYLALGQICMKIEDYNRALHYYHLIYDNFTKEDFAYQSNYETEVWALMEYAEIYSHLKMFDSALIRYNLFDTVNAPEKDMRIYLVSKGEYYFIRGNYLLALDHFTRGLAMHKKRNDQNEIVRTILDIANTHLKLKNDQLAMRYAREAMVAGQKVNAKHVLRDSYFILYNIYDKEKRADSAYFYFKKYISAKDSVADDQTKGAFAAMNYEQHIELLNNENLLAEQQLKNASLLRKILFFVIAAIIIVSLLIIGNILLKRKNEKLLNDHRQAEFQQKTAALEMEALRSQMNPHFIFNCLNAINRFILKNESEAAAEYLAQFSKLIRMVLHHSKQATIQLDDEIEMLKLYLQMESLRFKNAFDYKLIIEPGTETDGLFVPPLLLQPFLENAIWHGLMHKKDKGEVTIHFAVVDNMLKCTIQDNGVGRIAANNLKNKQSHQYSSVGLQITRDRLALINGMVDGEHVTFTIDDLYDAEGNATGTRVMVNIKLNTGIEQQIIKRHSKSFI